MAKHWYTSKVFIILLIATLVTLELFVINCESRLVPSPMAAGQEGGDDLELKSQFFEVSERDEFVRMAGYGEDKLSIVLITGLVLCNQNCLQDSHAPQVPSQSQEDMVPVSGALVEVTCNARHIQKKNTQAKALTDEYGEFVFDLPSDLHALQRMEKACSVKVLQMPKNSSCHQSASATRPKGIRLSSVGNGVRTYTTGEMKFFNINGKNSEACMKRQEDEQKMSW